MLRLHSTTRIFSLSLIALVAIGSGVDAQSQVAGDSKHPLGIVPSKETTFITEPVDKEGYIDYVRAINERYADGVTVENNFEVVVRSVLPPDEIAEEMLEDYFAALDVELSVAESTTYQDFITYVLADNKDADIRDELFDEHGEVMSAPWLANEHPRAAEWVEKFNSDLDRLAEGSRRSRYYQPYLAGALDPAEPYPRLVTMLLPSVQQQREIARALCIRAMGRIAVGEIEDAWSDVQALHRVSAHIGNGFTLIESLVAIAIDSIAFDVECAILQSPHLTDELAQQILADLKDQPRLPPIADRIDLGERFMGLDVTLTLARSYKQQGVAKSLELIAELCDLPEDSLVKKMTMFLNRQRLEASFGSMDWNVTLRSLNQWYDRYAAAAREPEFEQRRELLSAIEKEVQDLATDLGEGSVLSVLTRKSKTPEEASEALSNLLVTLLLPAINAACQAQEMSAARYDTLRVGFALECYQRENGKAAERLSDLVPEYLDSVPLDACSGKELNLVNKDDQTWVYSFGHNGRDDQGLSYDDAAKAEGEYPGWDDIVVAITKKSDAK